MHWEVALPHNNICCYLTVYRLVICFFPISKNKLRWSNYFENWGIQVTCDASVRRWPQGSRRYEGIAGLASVTHICTEVKELCRYAMYFEDIAFIIQFPPQKAAYVYTVTKELILGALYIIPSENRIVFGILVGTVVAGLFCWGVKILGQVVRILPSLFAVTCSSYEEIHVTGK